MFKYFWKTRGISRGPAKGVEITTTKWKKNLIVKINPVRDEEHVKLPFFPCSPLLVSPACSSKYSISWFSSAAGAQPGLLARLWKIKKRNFYSQCHLFPCWWLRGTRPCLGLFLSPTFYGSSKLVQGEIEIPFPNLINPREQSEPKFHQTPTLVGIFVFSEGENLVLHRFFFFLSLFSTSCSKRN